MALFSVKDSWSNVASGEEEFDAGGFCVGELESGKSVIVTGSLQGILRVYEPHLKEFQVNDLLLEQQLDEGVIQIDFGRFLSHGGGLGLAVLQPRTLSVYCLAEKEGGFIQLERQYTHQLGDDGAHFSAANMVFGPFGGVRGKDFIAVQSLDGQLHVFEQESFAFIRQLNHVLMPGPLHYVRKLDSLLVCNSQNQVDCYKYQVLASSVTRNPQQQKEACMIQTDWTFTVGEQILDIFTARVSKGLGTSQIDIFVLSDRSVYCLSERGVVRTHIKLDVGFNPMCSTALPLPSLDDGPGIQNVLIFSESAQLSILREFCLIWRANMSTHLPVAVRVTSVGGVNGMIVTMSDDGMVVVSYLGTDPAANLSLPKPSRRKALKPGASLKEKENASKRENMAAEEIKHADDMEYEEMDREHRKLLEKIRNLHRDLQQENKSQSSAVQRREAGLLVRVQVPSTLDQLNPHENQLALSEDTSGEYATRSDGQIVQLSIKVFIANSGQESLEDVGVVIQLPEPFVSAQNCFTLSQLASGSRGSGDRPATPQVLEVAIRVKNTFLPSSLTGSVCCTYKTKRGAFKTHVTEFRLPFYLAVKARTPVKNSTCKFTLESSKEAVRLPVLFDDMLRQPGMEQETVQSISGAGSNVITFEYFNGVNATVLASKSGGRYRLQGGTLGGLWLLAQELENRLLQKFGGPDAVSMDFEEPLPLASLFSTLEAHHAARLGQAKAMSLLNDRSHQYRLVQKRLLSRFKDKNAPPLNGLDTLLNVTHEQLMKAAQAFQKEEMKRHAFGLELSACIRLMNWLAGIKFKNLSSQDMLMIQGVFSCSVVEMDGSEMGWEEVADAAITHLLRTTLAKVPKTKAELGSAPPSKPMLSADISKLKKHISIFFDRLSKGATPSVESVAALAERKSDRATSDLEHKE